jgi:hypothetical protein
MQTPDNSKRDYAAASNAAPDISRHFAALYRSFWSLASVPAPTLELCRLRQAQLLQSELAWQHEEVVLPHAQRKALRKWPDSELFSAAEKACLELTEMHAMDAQAITDKQAAAVKAHYGEGGYVALVQALGVFDATTRLGLIWDLTTAEMP